MKVHERIVIDLASGAVLDDQWYEYDGPVARADGGGGAPAPSPEERKLQAEQAETLRLERMMLERQLGVQDLLAPFLYEELGLRPSYGSALGAADKQRIAELETRRAELQQKIGDRMPVPQQWKDELRQLDSELSELRGLADDRVITSFNEIPATEAELLREQIDLALLERSMAALKGELPVSPTLEREITDQGETLRARLRRNLGPGFETSSPGIEALQGFESRAIEAREAARRGELTLAEQLSLARGGQNFEMGSATRGQLSGIPAMHPSFANVISGYNAPLNRMMEDRYARYQIEASQPSFGSTLGQFLGVAGGYAAGGIGAAIGTAIGDKYFGNAGSP